VPSDVIVGFFVIGPQILALAAGIWTYRHPLPEGLGETKDESADPFTREPRRPRRRGPRSRRSRDL
jgi:hypothetical protein